MPGSLLFKYCTVVKSIRSPEAKNDHLNGPSAAKSHFCLRCSSEARGDDCEDRGQEEEEDTERGAKSDKYQRQKKRCYRACDTRAVP